MGKEFAPEGVITDFDNTLVKTHHFVREHIQRTCARLEVESPEDKEVFRILEGNPPFEEIFDKLFGKNSKLVLSSYRENAMETHYHPTEGGAEFIRALYESAKKIIIVSNRTRKLPERLSQANYNPAWFMAILSADKPKPDKSAYLKAINRLEASGVDRSDIYILGDDVDDYISCPDDLRDNFIAVLSGLNSSEDFEKLGLSKERMVESLDELLKNLNG